MKKVITAMALSATLAGCMTAEERNQARLDRAGNTCATYGFSPNTGAFAACVQRDVQEQRERTRQAWQAVASSMQQMQTQRQLQRLNRPRYTNCNSFGYSLSCTTF